MKDKIVLLYPSYDGPALGPPLSLLSLASLLLDSWVSRTRSSTALWNRTSKHRCRANFRTHSASEFLSLMGPMIRGAVALSQLARRLQPGIPVLFGGWHSSLLLLRRSRARCWR